MINRPPNADPDDGKLPTVTFQATPAVVEALAILAEQDDRSRSAVLRTLVLSEARRRGLTVEAAAVAD